MPTEYQPDWRSLIGHTTPQWLRDDKFGIYTHWGVYSVPGCGKNGTWYPYFMYQKGNPQYDFHVANFGPPSSFGYKDFIPMFTAERFDPDEWAELFAQAGARFAGPVAEHHDGFAMWDTKLSDWNAVKMGPKRDIVAELERSIRRQGMRYMVALHHAELWYFYPHWETEYDTSDPTFAGLYGEPHDLHWVASPPDIPKGPFSFWRMQTRPDRKFHEHWLGKAREVIDAYRPDLLWLDNGILFLQEHYLKQLAAYYYNRSEEWGEPVALTYKMHELVPGSALVDLELGRFEDLTYHEWITDTSVDDQGAWSYVKDAPIKPAEALIHNLVDNVSKNGYLLVNVGPRPDGTIPEQVKQRLVEMGRWLEINGEAIYGTTPWLTFGEGPTKMEKAGPFSERQEVKYTSQDIRFTSNGSALYAICLGWPHGEVTITSCSQLYEGEIESVTMLGSDEPLTWRLDGAGLTVTSPSSRPCNHAYVFKIKRTNPLTRGPIRAATRAPGYP